MPPLHSRYPSSAGEVSTGDENRDGSTATPNAPPYESERQNREVEPGHERLVHRQRIRIMQEHAGLAGGARCRPHGKPVQEHFADPIRVRDEGMHGINNDGIGCEDPTKGPGEYTKRRRVHGIDPADKVAHFKDHDEPYELFIGIPVHKVPDVLVEAGLTAGPPAP
jgi:hypothetical protein